MSNTRYTVYRNSILDLVSTLVIKSELTADAINKDLLARGHVVLDSTPTAWKYYMNMAGEYHLTDTPMSIVSLDTRTVIAFTKANLVIHRTTARGYAYGTRYYNELVAKYPTQESLILGILNPVDLTTAIDAPDGQILYYNTALVEENEYNLIPNLQNWINVFLIRWNVSDYRLTDDLYAPSMIGVMFALMPGAILGFRTANCKTNQAHSYHIREYLAANGKLDVYMEVLTKKQALFLYRNIKYIHHNVGKTSTFNLLVEKILSDRNLPLAAYEMRHNTTPILEPVPKLVTDDEGHTSTIYLPPTLRPSIELVQSPLNLQQVEGRDDVITIEEMLVKEIPQARDNGLDLEAAFTVIDDKMATAYTNRVKTKVLESVVVDNSDDGPYRFIDTLLYEWIHLAFKDVYIGVVAFVNPVNGKTITLSTKDAFIYHLFCLNKSYGYDLTGHMIPTIQAMGVRRLEPPTLTELRDMVVTPNFVDESNIFTVTQASGISITGGTYSKNDGAFTAATGTVAVGDVVRIRIAGTASSIRCVVTTGSVKRVFNGSNGKLLSDAFLQTILDDQIPLTTIISSESFYTTARAIHSRLLLHRLQYSSIEHFMGNGMARAVAGRCYVDSTIVLAPEDTAYEAWVHAKGLDDLEYGTDDYGRLADNILRAATGLDNTSAITLKEIQAGCLRLMAQLSSYTVQYIPTINSDPYIAVEWAVMRQGDARIREKGQDLVKQVHIQALDVKAKDRLEISNDAIWTDDSYQLQSKGTQTIEVDATLSHEVSARSATRIWVGLPTFNITNVNITVLPPIP